MAKKTQITNFAASFFLIKCRLDVCSLVMLINKTFAFVLEPIVFRDLTYYVNQCKIYDFSAAQ